MNTKKIKYRWLYTILFSALSIAWVFPILLVIQNSFKKKVYISRKPFELPLGKMFVKLDNYSGGMEKIQFFDAFKNSLFITVCSKLYPLSRTNFLTPWTGCHISCP